MDDRFYERYRCYENYPIENLNHLPDISLYNHNYYRGIDKDIIYVETDELSGISEFYLVTRYRLEHFGFAYEDDEYITLQEEELS